MLTESNKLNLLILLPAALTSVLLHYLLLGSAFRETGLQFGVLFSGLLTAASLFLLSIYSTLTSWRLFLLLLMFVFVHFLMMQLEAFLFDLGSFTFQAIFGVLVLSFLVTVPFGIGSKIYKKFSSTSDAATLFVSSLKEITFPFLICSFSFPVIYFLAGITILPFVREFYGDLIPPIQELMTWQLLRGFIFTAISIPIIQNLRGGAIQAGIIFAIAFPILGGIAPLLLPNPNMPPNIQQVHIIEIGFSYMVYGFLLGYIFKQNNKAHYAANT